jgi:hypothetical protein
MIGICVAYVLAHLTLIEVAPDTPTSWAVP